MAEIEELLQQANAARREGRTEEARRALAAAVELGRTERDGLFVAHTMRHLGDVLFHAGMTAEAEQCFLEALELYRAHDRPPPLDLANALRPLAILYGSTERPVEAVRLWREARDLYASLGIREGVAEGDAWLARLGAA